MSQGAEIVKVQIPLAGGVRGRGMVYAKGRSRMTEQPIPPRVLAELAGIAKGFYSATYDRAEGWTIGDKADDQDW